MIAYNRTWLDNLYIHDEAEEAYNEKYISMQEKQAIEKVYPVGFYTPNFFIRIGLIILTAIIAIFSFGLLILFFLSDVSEITFGNLLIFIGLVMYAALEFMVRGKNHFRSGVDDALLTLSGASFITGLNLIFNISWLGNSILIFAVALYFLLRFIDALASLIAAIAFLAVVFFTYIKLGAIAKATMPFVIMIISAGLYFVSRQLLKQPNYRHYFNCLIIVKVTGLICFYLAGNYFVVKEASILMFNLNLKPNESIPLGWLFWIFTTTIPFVYIFRGIQKKDEVLIRTGLILIAVLIFTVRYYHAIFPIETTMTLSGILLIAISYALIKYLKTPKQGFTYDELSGKNFIDKINIEALIITETFGQQQVIKTDNLIGGGSGGGGGATGEF